MEDPQSSDEVRAASRPLPAPPPPPPRRPAAPRARGEMPPGAPVDSLKGHLAGGGGGPEGVKGTRGALRPWPSPPGAWTAVSRVE